MQPLQISVLWIDLERGANPRKSGVAVLEEEQQFREFLLGAGVGRVRSYCAAELALSAPQLTVDEP